MILIVILVALGAGLIVYSLVASSASAREARFPFLPPLDEDDE